MKTIIKKLDNYLNISEEDLAEAISLLKAGEVVAFPTETVYGLGADALNAEAVAKIFAAKGRPNDNPLIVHVSGLKDAKKVAHITQLAEKLAGIFWPGPLTLVLPKKSSVPDIVCAGLDTVAVRMPGHPLTSALLKQSGLLLAAPSANISGRPSPTCAQHVREDLEGKIAMILDGGPADIGLESTVLDIAGQIPRILRPGKITAEDLLPYLGKECQFLTSSDRPAAPGMKYAHYAPKGKVILADSPEEITRIYGEERKHSDKIFIISSRETAQQISPGPKVFAFGAQNDPESFAKNLFSAFRLADTWGAETVIVETVEEKGIGAAIMNRLKKSAAKK